MNPAPCPAAGFSIYAAEEVARVVAGMKADAQAPFGLSVCLNGDSPGASNNICSITIGLEIPIGGLLPKPGVPPLVTVDLLEVNCLHIYCLGLLASNLPQGCGPA